MPKKEKKAAGTGTSDVVDLRDYELKTVSVELLEPNSWNPQTQDDVTFNRLREEIRRVGFIDPCEVVPLENGRYLIIGGEHRWKAAILEGLKEIPIIALTGAKWQDDDLRRFVTVRMNMIRGKLDPEKFLKLYNEMADKYGADALQDAMGFTDAKLFQKMLPKATKGLGLSDKDQKELNEKAKEAKSVEELASILQEMFARYGSTIEQSFMVFTHGKQQHIYISMDLKMKRSMEKVVEYCKMFKEDINGVMSPIVDACMREVEARMASVYSDQSAKGVETSAD
jgi:hypothetical protein